MKHIVNSINPSQWKRDIEDSIKQFNSWYIQNAPVFFDSQRDIASKKVRDLFQKSNNLKNLGSDFLIKNPGFVSILRMCTCPPIARDRLSGLAMVDKNFINKVDRNGTFPERLSEDAIKNTIEKISNVFQRLLDKKCFPWLMDFNTPSSEHIDIAIGIISVRFCSSLADPIIRNKQEERQLLAIKHYLIERGYHDATGFKNYSDLACGEFLFRSLVTLKISYNFDDMVNTPVDVVIKRKDSDDLPLFIECKSAGDFTNVNKRRKEEAAKSMQFQATFGNQVDFILFLCGYFDKPYLEYEAAEGLDWVWEHRISDLEKFGV